MSEKDPRRQEQENVEDNTQQDSTFALRYAGVIILDHHWKHPLSIVVCACACAFLFFLLFVVVVVVVIIIIVPVLFFLLPLASSFFSFLSDLFAMRRENRLYSTCYSSFLYFFFHSYLLYWC
jgi:hypothetical protein